MITRLIMAPPCGDSTLKAPKEYSFIRSHPKEYDRWLLKLQEVFKVDTAILYREIIVPKIAGYIVKDKEKIIGCVSLSNMNGFPNVMYLWVDPDYRRKRIGWFLVNMCLLRASANSYFEVRAVVEQDNFPTLELLAKIGFKEMQDVRRTPIIQNTI